MEKGSRRHVPAFGEWNYYYYYAPEPEACSDVRFKYSPPPRKPASKKVRRPEGKVAQEKGRRARAFDAGGVVRAPAKAATRCKVVRLVDEDLYQVPPPEFVSHRPRRKRAVRNLWMGCLGLNCVA